MGVRDSFRPLRQAFTIYLAVAAVSAAALGGLSWHILAQDRDLEGQHRRERLEQAADRAAAVMQRALADLQAQLGLAAATPLPTGSMAVSVSAGAVDVRPAGALLYSPVVPADVGAPSASFAEGERLEFNAGDLQTALRAYVQLTGSDDVAARAGALLRAARVSRKRRDPDAALAFYERLHRLGPVVADGLPAGLAARLGRLTVFTEIGRTADLTSEARALLADLQQGRWLITKGVYDAYVTEARSLLHAVPASVDDADLRARADAVLWLWTNRQANAPSGRRLLTLDSGPALVLWSSRPSALEAVVASREYLAGLCDSAFDGDVSWSISDLDGGLVLGTAAEAQPAAVRTASAAGLPWTVTVFTPPGVLPTASPRRPLLVLALSLVTLVLAAGWYFIFRSLARERQTAQLQTDFVAAVSHEFRSPLTSINHIAELLDQDRLASDAMRKEAYGVLVRDSSRLRGLVEGLLDFGRFDAGASAFRFDTVDLGEIVTTTVADFEDRVKGDGYRIEVSGVARDLWAQADREAVTRALWNLLDNAAKYSPEQRLIQVRIEPRSDTVSIAVRDRGIGIPADEQRRVFERFIRGVEPKARRIKGTGIGLAMVRQIVLAHGGQVFVTSEPGHGSCFTIDLPIIPRGTETWHAYSSSKTNPA